MYRRKQFLIKYDANMLVCIFQIIHDLLLDVSCFCCNFLINTVWTVRIIYVIKLYSCCSVK